MVDQSATSMHGKKKSTGFPLGMLIWVTSFFILMFFVVLFVIYPLIDEQQQDIPSSLVSNVLVRFNSQLRGSIPTVSSVKRQTSFKEDQSEVSDPSPLSASPDISNENGNYVNTQLRIPNEEKENMPVKNVITIAPEIEKEELVEDVPLETQPAMIDLIHHYYEYARSNPADFLKELAKTDIFGTQLSDPSLFVCPTDPLQFVDDPAAANSNNAQLFREKAPGSFIFYQHLRKAGGTGFCKLTQSNLPLFQVPQYYCMPDNRGSLATPPWNNVEYMADQIHKHDYR